MGTIKISKKTAADYIIRRFNLEASEDATMVQDDTNYHQIYRNITIHRPINHYPTQ